MTDKPSTKMERATLILKANLSKCFDFEGYEAVSAELSDRLLVPLEKGRGYFRHVVIHEMVLDQDGRPLPRVWLKKSRKAAASAKEEADRLLAEIQTAAREKAPVKAGPKARRR